MKNRLANSVLRIFRATLWSFPGIAVALAAKPLVLGESVLLVGLLFAVLLPLLWLMMHGD